ncbi:FAD-dependent oxidoreductase [Pseudomonas sp. GD03858]|uniref:FAD-dependent oxidoreductase n=1 Tax=unclassified Pseudomonas TaxID=196821 RepID=UPI00244B77D7|nr:MULTISPECIES: FAD-dependent oxidoreductase [unclassified Pseudomonas]MDH0648673.1 FAD-dependent oxidoreductase [Pseudomonas sp. GD03867]MDH0660788.1 FAD-dependent oxidoreductase [Pseudomonas sp. GD03858]
MNSPTSTSSSRILVEAEDFEDYGGWVLDSQFETVMGSPYLLAHGLGRPVSDATTSISIPRDGEYQVWVRAKDWVPSHHPGRFTVSIDGVVLDTEFGANGLDWSWQPAGKVLLKKGTAKLALHDVTGFDGRCDAIYFSTDEVAPPNDVSANSQAWRKELRGLPYEPVDAGHYDVVVVGGGISGCAAALTAARLGQHVALIHDRPVLGGNASKEIGLMPRGSQGVLLKELSQRSADGDLAALSLLEAEPTVAVFLGHRVVKVEKQGERITAVQAVQDRGGHERRFAGSIFIDTSGTAILGVLGGAQTLFGREARSEYNEPYAPEVGDSMHHGNTLFFRTRMADSPVPFPVVPWATEVSKDYANLSGQLMEAGLENGPGPQAGSNPSTPEFRFGSKADIFPATHFWEYGQWLDPYKNGELIRDYLMRALYGTFSNVKNLEPEIYANLEFEWMAYVAAQGEFRRYCGDYVLSENDIRDHSSFPDALVPNDGAFCIHCAWEPGEGKYDFRLKDWIWDMRDKQAYSIPFRCLYSANIENLLVAGKHISVTHVAGSSTKTMGNGSQHGIAVGAAASLCNKHNSSPRGLYENHLDELKALVQKLTACDHEHPPK